MIPEPWLYALAGTLLALGGYAVGVHHAEVNRPGPLQVWSEVRRRLRPAGFLWAMIVPALGLLAFYGLVVHVRLTLGGWPEFGTQLTGVAGVLTGVAWLFVVVGVVSVYAVPMVSLVCLLHPRSRHLSVYCLAYAAALSAAWGLAALAPRPFLNWFLD